jgi:hypothetical protein
MVESWVRINPSSLSIKSSPAATIDHMLQRILWHFACTHNVRENECLMCRDFKSIAHKQKNECS